MVKPVKKGKGKAVAPELDAEALLASARESLDRLDPSGAAALCRQAVSADASSVLAWDTLAEACLTCGEAEEAGRALHRSIELSPAGAPGRYMYLAQLSDSPAEAVGWFEKGVAGLRAEREALQQASGERSELQAAWAEATCALAVGLCSAAELYLTDLCDEPEAEGRCDALTGEALQLVSDLPAEAVQVVEPFQTRASLKLSQEAYDDAEPLLLRALEVVRRAEEAEEGGGGVEMPSLELRLALAKMLLEVDRHGDALELLQGARVEARGRRRRREGREGGGLTVPPPPRRAGRRLCGGAVPARDRGVVRRRGRPRARGGERSARVAAVGVGPGRAGGVAASAAGGAGRGGGGRGGVTPGESGAGIDGALARQLSVMTAIWLYTL